jgi:hypothetical protein
VADNPNPIEMQKFLGGVDYPASKDDLIEHAEQQGADKEVLDNLRKMPDREYNGPNAVSQEFARS